MTWSNYLLAPVSVPTRQVERAFPVWGLAVKRAFLVRPALRRSQDCFKRVLVLKRLQEFSKLKTFSSNVGIIQVFSRHGFNSVGLEKSKEFSKIDMSI
jgi:hypothetical protein